MKKMDVYKIEEGLLLFGMGFACRKMIFAACLLCLIPVMLLYTHIHLKDLYVSGFVFMPLCILAIRTGISYVVILCLYTHILVNMIWMRHGSDVFQKTVPMALIFSSVLCLLSLFDGKPAETLLLAFTLAAVHLIYIVSMAVRMEKKTKHARIME